MTGEADVAVSTHVDAPPGEVDDLVADLARQGLVRWPGCTLTEERTDRRSPASAAITGMAIDVRDRASHNRHGMERTLAALKAAAEAGR